MVFQELKAKMVRGQWSQQHSDLIICEQGVIRGELSLGLSPVSC